MDRDNLELRREVYERYERIAAERRLSNKEIGDLTGICRNTLAKNVFLNDTALYLNTFLKLCIGLDVLPSDLLDVPSSDDSSAESPEEILNRLDDRQLRAVLMHALSYKEAAV